MDNDHLVKGLRRGWASPFGQLAQWQLDVPFIVKSHLRCLKRRLRHYDNPPLRIIDALSLRLNGIPKYALNLNRELNNLDDMVYRLQNEGDKRGSDLVRIVGIRHLSKLNNGQWSNNQKFDMTYGYVETTYESDYEAIVLQSRVTHPYPVDSATLAQRLQHIRPQIDEGILHFAHQLVRNNDVHTLRLSRQSRPKSIDNDYFDENIRLG